MGSGHELVVIGAGPAGVAAAIEATRAGRSVRVIDKATFPRDKCCGDGLTASALRHLEHLGFDPATVPSWQPVDDVRVVAPSGRSVLFPLPRDQGQFAVIARRRELDAALVDLARRQGITIDEGVTLTGVRQDTDSVSLDTSEGPIETQAVIAADGMWSPTRRMLGLAVEGYRGDWHAFRQYVAQVSPGAARELVVWFDRDLLPGYIWSFPLADGAINLGFGIQRGRKHRIQEMAALWQDILERPHVRSILGPDAVAEGPHKAWPIPAALGDLPLTSGRVLFVGDAAGATDPMTGEGIGQALETGQLAARALGRGSDLGDRSVVTEAGAAYTTALQRSMIHDHRLAGGLSNILATTLGADASVVIAGSTAWTRRNFARWLFEDYPRALVATPRRWRRGALSRAGAFVDAGT